MRARYPDVEGYVERDGVHTFYEVYGDGEPTLLLLPTWSLVHSRFWKAQIPYLARHFRVVTFDGRGNGRSDRPVGPEHYGPPELAADALAVLDATGTERAITASISAGTFWNLILCANHPERVAGAIFFGAVFPDGEEWPEWTRANVIERRDHYEGPERYNVHHIRENLGEFAQWWAEQVCPEPHSTKPIEYIVDWALDSDGERIADTLGPVEAMGLATMGDVFRAGADTFADMARAVRCPTLVLQGELDPVTPPSWGAAIARETGGRLHPLRDTAHSTARKPVAINLAMRDFAHEVTDGPPRRDPTLHHDADGRPRALMVSSPIGLGHARRDLAIARELRTLAPDLQIDWLAQDPVTRVLEAEGESIHPASRHLASESRHFECESAEHDLHCFQTLRRMDEVLINNFMVFQDVAEQGAHDLWIADEGWDVDYYLHENPSLKRAPYAWLTDFVGFLPVEDADERERFLTADYNAEMVEHIAAHPELRDRAVFVGSPDDIVDEPLGPDLPLIRDWTEEHFAFAGYVTGIDPASLADRDALRAELGYAPDERVCVVTVGGSGIGADLLRRVIAAYPQAKRGAPDLRMIVVSGPRIDPDSLPYLEGLEALPYVPDLYKHLAACDLAVVQGGLTTAMELTAGRRPFIYFPLKHHFEQRIHVAHRLDRYGAGRRMEYDDSPPDAIAAAIVEELGREVDYRPVESDGARRAAASIAELLN
ncbi:MAG TPA: alpha/beta fold hydrolase [Solirubrobacteraceae bacterium]|nr:alpha/beta fold hydrolase [Solirubrobacteraceae bacterium]